MELNPVLKAKAILALNEAAEKLPGILAYTQFNGKPEDHEFFFKLYKDLNEAQKKL